MQFHIMPFKDSLKFPELDKDEVLNLGADHLFDYVINVMRYIVTPGSHGLTKYQLHQLADLMHGIETDKWSQTTKVTSFSKAKVQY